MANKPAVGTWLVGPHLQGRVVDTSGGRIHLHCYDNGLRFGHILPKLPARGWAITAEPAAAHMEQCCQLCRRLNEDLEVHHENDK